MRSIFKAADIIIIILIAGFSFFSAFNIYFKPQSKAAQVLIRAEGKEWAYPIDAEEIVEIKGPLGSTVIKINAKKAQIISSPCDNKTCIATGLLAQKGQWSACLPNNVLLIILGDEGELDVVTW